MWLGRAAGFEPPDQARPSQNGRRNSRFIPEAERGWHDSNAGVQSRPGLMTRRSSSGAAGSGSSSFTGRWKWTSPYSIRAPWTAVKDSNGTKSNGALLDVEAGSGIQTPERGTDDASEDEIEEDTLLEEEEDELPELRSIHSRDRSNSVPDLPSLDRGDSGRSRTPPSFQRIRSRRDHAEETEPLRLNLSEMNSTHRRHIESSLSPTPMQLTQQNSITPSLELQRTFSPQPSQPRGYAWQPNEDHTHSKKGFVHPSHRNPTALQAFYDTHFGSSSGFRSVASLADDIFHPIGNAKSMFNRLSTSSASGERRESKETAKKEKAQDVRATPANIRDSLASWRTMPFSPAIFGGMGSSASTSVSSSKSAKQGGAYEPELIPTIHRDSHASHYFKRLEGNVVVMGGYRGSILRDSATKQMIWVPLKVGVGLRRPTLELGLEPEAEDRSEDLVKPDEMLAAIGNMVDSGKRLIARCTRKKTKVHSFGYDWRLGLARSSERLEAYLQQLWEDSASEENERRGAKVVAHSMGGLVALHALCRTKNPRIFDALVFASTPFLGTANMLGPFAFGDAALWNDEICSPRATFSFRSSFYLLPVNASRGNSNDTRGGRCFEEEDGTPRDLDFLDVATWAEFGFSPCVKRRVKHLRDATTEDGAQLKNAATRDDDKADTVPGLPGAGIQLQATRDDEDGGAGKGAEGTAQPGLSEALRLAKSITGDHKEDTNETLQPANRQQDQKQIDEGAGEAKEDEEDDRIAWQYLERTLAEVRQFYADLRTGFSQDLYEQGAYPPMAILTSGRTPTVRGALIWPRDSPELAKQEEKAGLSGGDHDDGDHWRRTVRLSDYSRMLYAPGDGVILRESAATMPGEWGRMLVRDSASADEHGENVLTNDEGIVETSHRHVTLLSDVDGIGRCLEACRRARARTHRGT